MNNNPIEELRRMETPVTEEGWNSIVNDQRYARKFGRKNGLSPKGRAAIIGGAAAVLIAVPILVKTLTHSAKETAQTNIPTTENVQPATENVASTSTVTSAETTPTTVSAAKSEQETHTPSKIAVTEQVAKHEGSTMTSVIAKRQQNAVSQEVTNNQVAVTQPVASPVTNEPKAVPVSVPNNIPLVDNKSNQTAVSSSKKGKSDVRDAQASVSEESAENRYQPSTEEPVTDAEQFFIPSAFTPNGDGLNDLFLVKANFEPRSFEMAVLSRGGDVLFQTRDMNIGWDGMLHGKLLPQGVYVIIIKYKDSEGSEHKQQGQVLLIP